MECPDEFKAREIVFVSIIGAFLIYMIVREVLYEKLRKKKMAGHEGIQMTATY